VASYIALATALQLYVNGSRVQSAPGTGLITTSSEPLRTGGNSVWGKSFQGRIDEVRMYQQALSASKIQADMTMPRK